MSDLMIFEGQDVERVELDGELYFNPSDVGRCLALSEEDLNQAVLEMDSDEYVRLTNEDTEEIEFRELHDAGEYFITESAVYKLVFTSKTKEAKQFKQWLIYEVFPSIFTTGEYFIDEKAKEEYERNLMDRALKLAEETLKKRDERIKRMREEYLNTFNVENDE